AWLRLAGRPRHPDCCAIRPLPARGGERKTNRVVWRRISYLVACSDHPPPFRRRVSAPLLPRRRTAERHRIGGGELLADPPQRDADKFQMRPGERNADDGHREHNRGDEMSER